MGVGEDHLKLSAGGGDAIKPETTVLLENQFWFVASVTTQLTVQMLGINHCLFTLTVTGQYPES